GPSPHHDNRKVLLNSQVVGGLGTTVAAGPRVNSSTPLTTEPSYDALALYVDAKKVDLVPDLGQSSKLGDGSNTVGIVWNANVRMLSGPNPHLVIDQDGNIAIANNVSVDGGLQSGQVLAGLIRVDDIANKIQEQAYFVSDTIGGSGGTWDFRDTFDNVTIQN